MGGWFEGWMLKIKLILTQLSTKLQLKLKLRLKLSLAKTYSQAVGFSDVTILEINFDDKGVILYYVVWRS